VTAPAPQPRLTPRNRAVLDFIRTFTADHGYPPSVREVGEAVGLASTSSVHHQLRSLARKGYLRRDVTVSRGVVVDAPDRGAGRQVRVTVDAIVPAGVTDDEYRAAAAMVLQGMPATRMVRSVRIRGGAS
jgi:repressor LexA